MKPLELPGLRLFLTAALLLVVPACTTTAQTLPLSVSLPRNRFRSGEETLQAFAPTSAATRHSIVKFNVDGETVAFGTVVSTNGLALTKASELRKGKLTCWLATDEEAKAELLATDPEEDVAFVRVHAKGLKPIQWASERVTIGEWAITPGIGRTPYAVGIISALPRAIRPSRAFMGIQFDFSTSLPKIAEVLPGLGAEQAGLKVGDVIVALNDEAVSNREQVITFVGDCRDGQSITVDIERSGVHSEATVQLKVPKPGQLGRQASAERRQAQMEGEVSQRAGGFEQVLEHDTVLPPWLCGGPLVNLDGKAIGVNIARAGGVSTYALSAGLVNQLIENFEAEQTQ